MVPQPKQPTPDQIVNIFARWFGVLLTHLKGHDLRLAHQPREPRPYARDSKIKGEKI
jgi:hypothetical protein